jgi:hypothetical protein
MIAVSLITQIFHIVKYRGKPKLDFLKVGTIEIILENRLRII